VIIRTILAALHFNYNLNRESKLDDHGEPRLRVNYVKYKYGEATIKEVKIPQNYGNKFNITISGYEIYIVFIQQPQRQQT